MEDELWPRLYELVRREAARKPRPRRVAFGDGLILLVLLWAALHERPTCWACQPRHWPAAWRPLTLPSASTVSRRARTLSLRTLLAATLDALSAAVPRALCRTIDTKPLTVGGFSKDRDARRGYAAGAIARGYKLCCVWGPGAVPDTWRLAPLNRHDAQAAAEQVEELSRGPCAGGYLLADALHDDGRLHCRCRLAGFQLLAPRVKPGRGLRHAKASDPCNDPGRLRSLELTEGPGRFGRELYATRKSIERRFGNLCSFGGGLSPLPAWVRRPRRVSLWVAAKLAINGVRICALKRLNA